MFEPMSPSALKMMTEALCRASQIRRANESSPSPGFHDYESFSVSLPRTAAIVETYDPSSIIEWQGNIERQVEKFITQYEAGRNYGYVDKLRQFLTTWRKNVITGSLNRETLDPLEAAAGQLAVDSWKLNSYFSTLRDQVRKLVASEEKLPNGQYPEPKAAEMGGAGGAPAGLGDFGAQDQAPPGEQPPPGAEGEQPPPGAGGPPPAGQEPAPGGPAGPQVPGEEEEDPLRPR